MAGKQFSPRKLFFCISKILLRNLGLTTTNSHTNLQKNTSILLQIPPNELSDKSLIFDVEGALLKSQSLFPYFMLVAFETGGLIRALLLLLLYPFVCVVGTDMAVKAMVFVSFCGIRRDKFRAGTTVLPKFFLEDVGLEGFKVVKRFGRKIGVSSKMPRVMIAGFLRDYMGVESVIGRELKVFHGYYVGLMEGKEKGFERLKKVIDGKEFGSCDVGIGCSSNFSIVWQLLQQCKEVYSISQPEKTKWKILPKSNHPKPLIFHDGRLVFRPTPSSSLAMFIWLPFGFFLSITRIIIGILLPFNLTCLLHAATGAQLTVKTPKPSPGNPVGVLYACNHRTLLDPIYISLALLKPVSAVTYSMSRFNEVISPIRTVRLTRTREPDRRKMGELLRLGDVVVCPEGTTCREPYLLRFSPLFAEISEEIVPVAIDVRVGMFYGSTASGLKCLDPVFQLLNPRPEYRVKVLEKLPAEVTHGMSKYDVANRVRKEIAESLGFECVNLTRKDKYMILAGNEGIV